MADLVPRGGSRAPIRSDDVSPFFSLQREMNRMFDDAFRNFGLPMRDFGNGFGNGWPSLEVTDNDKEVRVAAELPGLEEKDVELDVHDGVLTIRGEKRTETEDKDRQYSERYYGRFERRVALPTDVDDEQAKATFKNGVLTVVMPKTERARQKAKKIAISKS